MNDNANQDPNKTTSPKDQSSDVERYERLQAAAERQIENIGKAYNQHADLIKWAVTVLSALAGVIISIGVWLFHSDMNEMRRQVREEMTETLTTASNKVELAVQGMTNNVDAELNERFAKGNIDNLIRDTISNRIVVLTKDLDESTNLANRALALSTGRHLTDDQKAMLVKQLKPIFPALTNHDLNVLRSRQIMIVIQDDPEAARFAQDFRDAFTQCDIPCDYFLKREYDSSLPNGVLFGPFNGEHSDLDRSYYQKLIDAFQASRIEIADKRNGTNDPCVLLIGSQVK